MCADKFETLNILLLLLYLEGCLTINDVIEAKMGSSNGFDIQGVQILSANVLIIDHNHGL